MIDIYGTIQEWLMQHAVLPLLYLIDGMGYADDAITALDWLMFGSAQLLIIAFILRPLEVKQSLAGLDQRTQRKLVAADVTYTFIHRLGIFRLGLFFLFSPIFFLIESNLHDFRFLRLNVEGWWPSVTSIPWVSFSVYLVTLDFVGYVYHRASHYWNWWWQLHALHHSQRYMTAWTDDRNHVLDDLGHAAIFAIFALIIGVEPIQYIALIATSQLLQSWQHGNFNVDLGWAKYLIISPRYHRLHHAIGIGHEAPDKPGILGGCNFGIIFPWWDMLFGTAIFTKQYYETGVRDLSVSTNLLKQQWQGLQHSMRALLGK